MFFRNLFIKLETKSFLVFYLLCKYRFKYFSKKDIEIYQKRRMRHVVEYAKSHARFFEKHYKGYDSNDLLSLPTINKKIMMANLTDYNTVGLTNDKILDFCLEIEKTRDFSKRLSGINIGMSSGTSGNKGVEIVTKEEEGYMKAALLARFDFPKKEKINLAFILRVSTPAFSLNKFGHKLTYISQRDSLDEIKKQLEIIQPNVLSGPPSMLKILAKEVESNRLNIRPKRIASYAEILYPDTKNYLSEVFGCIVHEIYKSTEGPIATTCKYGSLHINEDLVLVETFNSDGSITPIGQPCQKLIITDLHKKAQPIIRYEMNDIITISSHKCKCGSSFRVIDNIQGRADDLFCARNTKTNEWRYIFPDYIRRAIITSSDDIDEYQVVQNAPEKVLVRLQLKDNIQHNDFNEQKVIKKIKDVFSYHKCIEPEVSLVFEPSQVNENSKKLIRIYRNFKHDSNEK